MVTAECCLNCQISAVHWQRRSRNPGRLVTREINGERPDIFRLSQPSDGMNSDPLPPYRFWIGCFAENSRGQIGFDERRTNGVHANVLVAVVDCHALGEQHHCALGRRIRGAVSSSIDAQNRCHVDDRTTSCLPHVSQDSAREQPQSTDIDVESFVPLPFRDLLSGSDVQHAGVVNQNVQTPKRCDGLLDNSLDPVRTRYIFGYDLRRPADLSCDLFEFSLASPNQRDFCAFCSKRKSASPSDTRACPSHDCDLVS